jgi:hypothetical protein
VREQEQQQVHDVACVTQAVTRRDIAVDHIPQQLLQDLIAPFT